MRIVAGILMIIMFLIHGMVGACSLLVGGIATGVANVAEKQDEADKKAEKKKEEKKDEAEAAVDKKIDKEADKVKKDIKDNAKDIKKAGGIFLAFAAAFLLLAALEMGAAVTLFMQKAKGYVLFVGGLGIVIEGAGLVMREGVSFTWMDGLSFAASALSIVAALGYEKPKPPEQSGGGHQQQGYPGAPP